MTERIKKNILNKHFWKSLFIFISALLLVWTFTTFIDEAVKKDKTLSKKNNNLDNKVKISH